jgi:hypothetical protein
MAPATDPIRVQAKILDRSAFRKKLILRLLASPLTLLPVLAGVTDLLALWAFSIQSGMGIFAGIAGVLGGLGIFLTRLLVDRGAGAQVINALAQEAQREREAALDALERRLAADGDPRDDQCLRDLRALAKAFREGFSWPEHTGAAVTVEILAGVEELFGRCVRSIEKTLDLWYTSVDMAEGEARSAILDRREQILADVAASIRQMGRILAGLQNLHAAEGSGDSELAGLRQELGRSLEVAQRVSRRMHELDREIGMREPQARKP